VAKLLVSVRSALEAHAAAAAGAAVVDVKEPSRGPLGRAPISVWRAVRDLVPSSVPVSVALGELGEWLSAESPEIPAGAWSGISFRKLGLANAPASWREHWRQLHLRLSESENPAPAWIAVVYVDWQRARAPEPDAIIDAAAEIDECRGVLFDTWNKSCRPWIEFGPSTSRVDQPGRGRASSRRVSPTLLERRIARIRSSGRLVALAGGVDAGTIERLAPLDPDIFAVRGAACVNGDREAAIDPERVARLVQAAALTQLTRLQHQTAPLEPAGARCRS
jgi:uncharacterized protein (UPF0264 family)